MPLAAFAFIAYAAGLVIGFGGVAVVGGVVVVASGVIAWVAGRREWSLLAATAMAGILAAAEAARADARCAQAIREGEAVTLRLRSPLEPGRAARGVYAGRDCRVGVRLRFGGASVPAGSTVSARGVVARRGASLEVRAVTVRLVAPPGRLARWRAAVGARIDALFGADAPLARALLLADADDVDRALRDRFADAGIIHMLSVSGLHVAIIANSLRAGVMALGMAAAAAEVAALGTSVLFVAFIGAPPPAVRSVVMLVLVAVARRAQRPTAVWGVWGASCAASLVDPRVVLDLGWQLSATGMAGLLASAPLARRWCAPLRGWRRTLAEGVLSTSVASAATAPLVAWVFGRVSLAALVTNLAASPLFSVGQPLLFASLLVSPIDPLARLLADASRSVLWLVDLVARVGASLPLAVLPVQPDLATAAFLGVAAAALVVAAAGRWPRRPLFVALGAVAGAVWWPALAPGPGRLELHLLDVGQGDAVALRTPRGRWILVDAGGAWAGGDAARSVVLPYLRRRGGEVALLATTHPHADHIGGATRLIRTKDVATVWDGGYVSPSAMYREMLAAARDERTHWRRVTTGDSTSIDGVSLLVLAPDSAWLAGLSDPNEASLILRVSFGKATFLLTGDAETGEEGWLLEHQRDRLRADVLKVAHHGSATSSTTEFMRAVRPRVALVSVGAGNSYGHPSEEVLQRIEAEGAQPLRTDDEGTIVVSTNGHTMDVRANGATWRYYVGR